MIVLDTHVVVWAYLAPEKLSFRALDAVGRADMFGLSTISLWEIAMLTKKGRDIVDFPIPPEEWMKRLVRQERVRLLPISPEIAMRSVTLSMHGDPSDRVIAATALVHQCKLVTVDENITDAKVVETIW